MNPSRTHTLSPFSRLCLLITALLVMALTSSCHPPPPPDDGGAPTSTPTPTNGWTIGATISLTIARGAVTEALADPAAGGLTGTDAADYVSLLHLADDALRSLQGHATGGASACTIHADATHAVDAFERIAALLATHDHAVPGSILRGAARLVSVLEAALPPCADPGAETNQALGVRVRSAYGRAHAQLVVPRSPELP